MSKENWKVSFRLTDIDDRIRIEAVSAKDQDEAEAKIEVMEAGHDQNATHIWLVQDNVVVYCDASWPGQRRSLCVNSNERFQDK